MAVNFQSLLCSNIFKQYDGGQPLIAYGHLSESGDSVSVRYDLPTSPG